MRRSYTERLVSLCQCIETTSSLVAPWGAAVTNMSFSLPCTTASSTRSTRPLTRLSSKSLSAETNAPAAIDGDYVIAGAALPRSSARQPFVIAC